MVAAAAQTAQNARTIPTLPHVRPSNARHTTGRCGGMFLEAGNCRSAMLPPLRARMIMPPVRRRQVPARRSATRTRSLLRRRGFECGGSVDRLPGTRRAGTSPLEQRDHVDDVEWADGARAEVIAAQRAGPLLGLVDQALLHVRVPAAIGRDRSEER